MRRVTRSEYRCRMSSVLVATAIEAVRAATVGPLAREGIPSTSVADLDGLLAALCRPEVRLVLVDPELPRLRPGLVAELAENLGHRPVVRALGSAAGPIPRVPASERALLRLARSHTPGRALSPSERRTLALLGLGPAPVERLARLATSPLPLLLHGERGTGKERIAALVHRVSGSAGPFLPVLPTVVPGLEGTPGTLFLESVHRRDDLRALLPRAVAAGWRVTAGTRLEGAVADLAWERVTLSPLRERPEDLRGLAALYLEEHARRMGLPKRSFDRGMWALLHAHRWPQNHRELEMFVVQLLGRVDDTIIRGATLPEDLRALLLPRAETGSALESFEELARVRLAPVVAAWSPGGAEGLHARVVASAERALIQLVLARTQGSRKAAATFLGLARNTLQSRITDLGLGVTAER